LPFRISSLVVALSGIPATPIVIAAALVIARAIVNAGGVRSR
jgi:hypothetical protein